MSHIGTFLIRASLTIARPIKRQTQLSQAAGTEDAIKQGTRRYTTPGAGEDFFTLGSLCCVRVGAIGNLDFEMGSIRMPTFAAHQSLTCKAEAKKSPHQEPVCNRAGDCCHFVHRPFSCNSIERCCAPLGLETACVCASGADMSPTVTARHTWQFHFRNVSLSRPGRLCIAGHTSVEHSPHNSAN